MNDPLISAIAGHWQLALAFLACLSGWMVGAMRFRLGLESHQCRWGSLALAVTGLAGFVDCMIRAVR